MRNRFSKTWHFKRPDDAHIIRFENDGRTFSAYWKAEQWMRDNGYKFGSTCALCPYVAAVKGEEYNLPQKLYNFEKEDIAQVDAVIYSNDYRDGWAEVWILKDK